MTIITLDKMRASELLIDVFSERAVCKSCAREYPSNTTDVRSRELVGLYQILRMKLSCR